MPVMTPAGCVTTIAAVLATIGGIGNIHQYRRIIREEDQVNAHLFHTGQGRVNAWMISPSGANTTVTERHPGHAGIGVKGGGNVLTTFQFQIEGYFGIDDTNASEQTFRDLSWAVADEFNAYGAIGIPGITHQLPCDLEQFGFAMVANFHLLHYCRIGIGFQGRTRPNP